MEKKKDTMKALTKRSKKRKKIIFAAVVVLAIALGGVIWGNINRAAARETGAGTLQSDEVKIRSLVKSVGATGTVVSVDTKDVTVSLAGVKVSEVLVEIGDFVDQGDRLFIFDTGEIEDSLESAKKNLSLSQQRNRLSAEDAARGVEDAKRTESYQVDEFKTAMDSAYNEYKAAMDNYNSANDRLNELRKAEDSANQVYSQREEALANAKAVFEKAKSDFEVLESQGSVSPGDAGYEAYEAAFNAYEDASQAYQAATVALNSAGAVHAQAKSAREKQQTSVEALGKTFNNMALNYDKAVKKYHDTAATQASSVARAQSSQKSTSLSSNTDTEKKQIEKYEEQLEQGILRAPISGVVTGINYEAGDTYTAGTLLTIQDCSAYEIETMIGEYDISDIRLGQQVLIKTNATGQEELKGRVVFISPTAVQTAGAVSGSPVYKVRISVDTVNDRLRLDMSASLSIIIESHNDVFTVPYNAVEQREDGSYFITRVEEDGITTKEIPVTVIMESNYYTEIQSKDIHEGLKVLIKETQKEDSNILLQMGGGF